MLGTALLLTATASGVAALIERASTDGVRAGLASRVGADRGLRLTLPLAGDPTGQDATVRAALADSFAGIETPLGIDWQIAGPVSLLSLAPGASDSSRAVTAETIPGLAERADLVDGAWPTSPHEVAIQADAAAELDATPGTTIVLGDTVELRVSGTWRAADPLDPRWLGDDLTLTGHDPDGYGPVVVDTSVWSRLEPGDDTVGEWTLVPDATRITPADLREIPAVWAGLARAWRGDVPDVGGLRRQGSFPETAAALSSLVDGLFAVEPVALLLLAAAGAIALGQLGRLIAAGRTAETTLRWARGATPPRLALRAGGASALVAAAGAVLAAVPAILLGSGLTAPLLVGLLAALGAGIAVGLPTYGVAAARADPRRRRLGRRTTRTAGWTGAVLLLAAAVLAVWQLRLYGSPVVPSASGGGAVDPIAVSAPILALAAGIALGLALFPLATRALDRRTANASAVRSLATAELARRPLSAAASLAVVALATGSVVIAAGYAGTWATSFDDASRLRTGAALHVGVEGAGLDAATLDALAAADGVRAVAPIAIEPLTLGEDSGSLVGASPGAIHDLTRSTPGFDAAAVADAITARLPGVPLPEDARTASVVIATEGIAAPPEITALVETRLGRILAVLLTPDAGDDPSRITYTGDLSLPAADAPLGIESLDLRFAADATSDGATLTLLEAGPAGATTEVDGFWDADSPTYTAAYPNSVTPTTMTMGAGLRRARMTATLTGAAEDRYSAPVVISQALADRYGMEVGDVLQFPLEATSSVTASVEAIVPGIPGSPDASALLIDVALVRHAQLRAYLEASVGDLWIDAADSTATAEVVRGLLPPTASIDDAHDPAARQVLGAAVVAVDAVAATALVLALVALAATASAARSSRRPEAAILRALGFRAREQARLRVTESAVALGFGLLVGAASGAGVVVLAVGAFAIAAVPNAPVGVSASLGADPLLLAVGGAALGVTLVAVLAGTAAGARRDARSAVVRREEGS